MRNHKPTGSRPILGTTIHGMDLRAASANERLSAVTRGHDERRVQYRVEEVLAVAASKERPPLRRAHPLDDEEDPDYHERDRADDYDAKTGHRCGETCTTPTTRPTDRDEDAATATIENAGR